MRQHKQHKQSKVPRVALSLADREAAELYCVAYLEGYDNSTGSTFFQKREDARVYAREKYPTVGAALEEFARPARGEAITDSHLYALGSAAAHQLANLARQGRIKSDPVKKRNLRANQEVVDTPATPVIPHHKGAAGQENGTVTAIDKYEEWIAVNDFVASDAMIAHFTGRSLNYMPVIRSRMTEKGYKFAPTDTGWTVVERPKPVRANLDDLTFDELKELMRRFLEKA